MAKMSDATISINVETDRRWFAGFCWAMDRCRLEALMAHVGLVMANPSAADPDALAIKAKARQERSALSRRGDVGHIAIKGVILKSVPWFLDWLGIEATSTEDTSSAIAEAVGDQAIKRIVLDVDSPGGTVDGVQQLGDEIRAARASKSVHASVDNLAASAAYWLASQADTIDANRAAEVGSIGVYTVLDDFSRAYEQMGIKTHVIASHKLKGIGVEGAPITDPQIEETQRVIDGFADLFVGAVAAGRAGKMSREDVKEHATGQTWLADEAAEIGLIDTVRGSEIRTPTMGTKTAAVAAAAPAAEDSSMTEQEKMEMEKLRTDVAKAEATAQAQTKALAEMRAQQRKTVIERYADRFAPANRAMVETMADKFGDDVAGFEAIVAQWPKVTRDNRVSDAGPQMLTEPDVDEEDAQFISSAPKPLVGKAKVAAIMGMSVEDVEFYSHVKGFTHENGGQFIFDDGRERRTLKREELRTLHAEVQKTRTMEPLAQRISSGLRKIGFGAALLAVLFIGGTANATALTAAKPMNCKGSGSVRSYLMTASQTIYKGALVMLTSAGTAQKAAAAASNQGVVGFANETKTSAASGSYWITVEEGVACKVVGASLAQTAVGSLVYASDDQTVDETAGANEPIAGLLIQYDSATVGWVLVSPFLVTKLASTADPLTLTGDLTLAGGAGAATFTDSASSIVLPNNDATALLIGGSDQLNLITIDTGTNTETVIINGTTAVEAFNVAIGTSTFAETVTLTAGMTVGTTLGVTGDITASGGAGALTFSGSAASIVVDDKDSTALLVGSSGHLDLLTIDTTDDQETLTVTGQTTVEAFAVAVGTSTFTEAATFTAGAIVSDNGTGCFGSSSDACFEYDTAQTADTLMLGVGTDSESVIICQKADASTDFTHADQTNPTLFIHAADETNTAKWVSLAHDGTNGVLDVGTGVVTMPDGYMITDSKSGCFGASSDACFEYDGDQGPDSLVLWVSADSNAIIMAQKADQGVDFTHADAVNPTLFIQSADSTTVADYLALSHNQTDAHITTGSGDLHLEPNGADVMITGTLTVSAGLVVSVLEANLTAGACTAGTFKVDNNATRELCRCNDAGSAYDCVSVTTANGPSD